MGGKTEILYGVHPVREALKAQRRCVFEIYTTDKKKSGRLEKILAAAQGLGAVVKRVKRDHLTALAKTNDHQGIAAKASAYPMLDLDDFLLKMPKKEPPFMLVLDQVVDPRNLGALLRVCEGAGVGRVLVRDRGSAPLSATAVRTSAGAAEWLPVERAVWMVRHLGPRG